MADILNVQGAFTLSANTGLTRGSPTVLAQFAEQVAMLRKCETEYTLESDSAQSIPLNGLTGANFLYIFCDAAVTLRITTADGATQAVPVFPLAMLLLPAAKPITAVTVQRVPGTVTVVKLVMAQVDG